MNIRDLFNAPASSGPIERDMSSGGNATTPVFVTPQAILTFPVATFVISMASTVFTRLLPAISTGALWVPLIAALAVGAFIVYYSWNAQWATKDKVGAIFVGVVNTLYIYAAATGIQLGNFVGGAGAALPTPTPTP